MLYGTQEAGLSTLLYLNLPFHEAGIVSPIEEGVNPHCIRDFQRTFIEGSIDGIFKKYPLCQCTIFTISPHVLPRLLGVTAFYVQNNEDYIGKPCYHR